MRPCSENGCSSHLGTGICLLVCAVWIFSLSRRLSVVQSVWVSGKKSCQNLVVHPQFSSDVSHSHATPPPPVIVHREFGFQTVLDSASKVGTGGKNVHENDCRWRYFLASYISWQLQVPHWISRLQICNRIWLKQTVHGNDSCSTDLKRKTNIRYKLKLKQSCFL